MIVVISRISVLKILVIHTMAISQPPEGRVSWTMQMLADGLVEREIVDSISPETVRRTLKKTNSSLG